MNPIRAGLPGDIPGTATARSGDRTRWRILRSAIRTFAEKGFAGATIRGITQEAGVNSALIGFHFGGKDGLYSEALRVANRMAEKLVWTLPELPGAGEHDSVQRATMALRTFSGMILRSSFPFSSETRLEQGHGAGRWIAPFLAREMICSQRDAETSKVETLRPAVVYLEGCIRILRPDLNEDGRAWLALSIQGLMLLLISRQGFGSPLQKTSMLHLDLDSLVSHMLNRS